MRSTPLCMSLVSADNWYLILAGNAGVYIEELKDLPEGDGGEQGDSSANLGRGKCFCGVASLESQKRVEDGF